MTPTMPLHDSISKIAVRGFPILLFPLLLFAPIGCHSGTYDELKSLYDTMLTSSNYNPAQRPLLNQSDVLHVNVMFELVSILEINDVFQSFRCNGLLTLLWKDEVRAGTTVCRRTDSPHQFLLILTFAVRLCLGQKRAYFERGVSAPTGLGYQSFYMIW